MAGQKAGPAMRKTTIHRTTIKMLALGATFGVPRANECPNLTTYPRKIKHLHDDT